MEIFKYKRANIEVTDKGDYFSCKVYSDAVPFTTKRYKSDNKTARCASDWVYSVFFGD